MRALVATVGTGATVEDGIAFSINSLNPDRVYLICTPQSTAKIPLVVQRLDAPERLAQTPLSVRDPGDFDRTYLDCCHALEQMAADGFEPALCTVDYTSGTKVMSAALVAAGRDMGIGRFVYIDGLHRAGEGMRVVSSTEEARITRGGPMLAQRDLRTAIRLFNRCQWEGAGELASRATQSGAGSGIDLRGEALRVLSCAYRRWDGFGHREALELLREAQRLADGLPGVDLAANLAFLGKVGGGDVDLGKPSGVALLADLLNNAQRRMATGQHDDALARLYGATEMLAQLKLAQRRPRIDTGRVDVSQLPASLRADWRSIADRHGIVRAGLARSYELLDGLGDPVGSAFTSDRKMQACLTSRNHSILAHGLVPIPSEQVGCLYDLVARMASEAFENLGALRDAARFATLPEE